MPCWREALDIAARLGAILEMGYVGVDIVLDEARGPLVLEANARPGLAIQIANRCGLRRRLDERPGPGQGACSMAPASRRSPAGERPQKSRRKGPSNCQA